MISGKCSLGGQLPLVWTGLKTLAHVAKLPEENCCVIIRRANQQVRKFVAIHVDTTCQTEPKAKTGGEGVGEGGCMEDLSGDGGSQWWRNGVREREEGKEGRR